MKFIVTVKEVHTYDVEVDAETVEGARKKASDMLQEGIEDISPEYSDTMDPSEWNVTKVRGQ